MLIEDYEKLAALRGDRRQVHRLRQLRRCRLPGDPRHPPREGGQAERARKWNWPSCASRPSACTGCGLCVAALRAGGHRARPAFQPVTSSSRFTLARWCS
ncbi:MAG: hypothetical protein MZW92_11785 [Comamonadaceae bacterium]|nr:hypothetical protein [Comamonadaceae bacterium]